MPAVIVIGAGITGLTAAYHLHQHGIQPIVLEAGARAGGLILTEQTGGFTIEAGADSMLALKPAAVELCGALGLSSELLQVRPPGGAFVLRGTRLHALPKPSRLGIPLTWRALAGYDLLSPAARARMALEPLVPPSSSDDESVASFFRRRFGGATVDLIAQPLLGGIHAGDIDQLSMRALFPRLIDAERRDGQVLTLWRPRRRRSGPPEIATSAGAGNPFLSLRNGMGTLVTALERALPAGSIRYARRVERIDRTASGWTVMTSGERVDGQAVVIAAPAYVAAALLAPLDAEVARVYADVPYVSTASIALAWPRAAVRHPLSGTGFVVARRHSRVRITACTWVTSKWDHRAPDGSVLVRAFIGGAHDPQVVDLSDETLVDIARSDLRQVLGIAADPVLTRVYRWRNAGAQHIVGHLARMDAIERRLAGHPGLFVAGSGFRSIGIPDCVAHGRMAAEGAVTYVCGG